MITTEHANKDDQAHSVAASHYALEPVIANIIRLIGSNEEDAREPVKLLEVNSDTIEAGIIPVSFGPHPSSGAPYPTIIIEVTPREFEEIETGHLQLPDDWRLGPSIPRPNQNANGAAAHG
jgi:hypothetical protein